MDKTKHPAKVYEYDMTTNSSKELNIDLPFTDFSCSPSSSFYVYGNKAYQITDAVYAFEPSTLTYKKISELPSGLSDFGSKILVDDKIYCFNGKNITTNIYDDHIYVYNIATNTFEKTVTNSFNLNGSRGIHMNGKIYFFGTITNQLSSKEDNLYVYDIQTNKFETKTTIPAFAFSGTWTSSAHLMTINNNIYVFGEDLIYKYDVANNKIESLYNKSVSGFEVFQPSLINGKYYAFTGAYLFGESPKYMFEEIIFN